MSRVARGSGVIPLVIAAVVAGCSDAKPGTAPLGSGGAGSGGSGQGGTGNTGGGGGALHGPAPDFAAAAATPIATPNAYDDSFGFSVAVDGETVAVGAIEDDTGELGAGAVMVFVGPSLELTATLRPLVPDHDGFFGWSVAVDGDVAAVGARAHGEPSFSGSVFAHRRNGSSFVGQDELRDMSPAEGAELGYDVAVSGGLLVAGAPGVGDGRTLSFEWSGTAWENAGMLVPDVSAGAAKRVGFSVALDGTTAVVGAPGLGSPGRAFVFRRAGGQWTQEAELVPGDGGSAGFGVAVAIDGATVVVGTGPYIEGLGEGPGTAYVFVKSGDAWAQEGQLFAADGADGDSFGTAVAVSGDAVLVGAPYADAPFEDAGAAYVFERVGTAWSQQTRLGAEGLGEADRFGKSVALDGKLAAVGAVNDDTPRGRVVVFRAP